MNNITRLKSYFYLVLTLVAAVFFQYKGLIDWNSPILYAFFTIPVVAVIYFVLSKSLKEVN